MAIYRRCTNSSSVIIFDEKDRKFWSQLCVSFGFRFKILDGETAEREGILEIFANERTLSFGNKYGQARTHI